MKKQLFCFVMFLSALSLFAQSAIEFDTTTVDFGTIKEEGGKVTGKFEFTNTGNEDLILSGVKPGCGCTAADYTKTPIPPGKKGYIDATYNPLNRPGSFNKSIRVTTNEPKFEDPNAAPYLIYIKGVVEKREPTKYETAGYKTGSGNIRIKENSVVVNLANKESKLFTIQVMNFNEKPSTFEPLNFPSYITLEGKSVLLAPGQETEVTFKYDASKKGDIGGFKDILNIQTQDSIEPKIVLFVDAIITEDFSTLTPKQLQDAPVAVVDPLKIDFGKVEKNTTSTTQITVANQGVNPLVLRQIKSSTTVFSAVSDKNEIAKGGTAILTVTFNTRNRKGQQTSEIEIITNDPKNSRVLINCKGDISQ